MLGALVRVGVRGPDLERHPVVQLIRAASASPSTARTRGHRSVRGEERAHDPVAPALVLVPVVVPEVDVVVGGHEQVL